MNVSLDLQRVFGVKVNIIPTTGKMRNLLERSPVLRLRQFFNVFFNWAMQVSRFLSLSFSVVFSEELNPIVEGKFPLPTNLVLVIIKESNV